jgi:hypothetical protein
MNNILKATRSHFMAKRDALMAELEVTLNRGDSENVVTKAIDCIERLTFANLCINTVDAIIEDNVANASPSISELIAQRFAQNNQDDNESNDEQKD